MEQMTVKFPFGNTSLAFSIKELFEMDIGTFGIWHNLDIVQLPSFVEFLMMKLEVEFIQ
jgi:hypothetical protein